MDLERARRNLDLVRKGQPEVCEGSGDECDDGDINPGLDMDVGGGTLIPDSLGLSSVSSVAESQEEVPIFINTQVQGQLDDLEQENIMKSKLRQFDYNLDSSQAKSILKSWPAVKSRTSTRTKKRVQSGAKSVTQTNIEGHSKSEVLLKKLSGKHSKIKDILKTPQLSKSVNNKRGKKTPIKYDIYNAQEWNHIYQRLMETFPQTKYKEVGEVYHFLYGVEGTKQDLWTSSQLPPDDSYKDQCMSSPSGSPMKESQQATIMSLSQVMSDDFVGEKLEENHGQGSQKYDEASQSPFEHRTNELTSEDPINQPDEEYDDDDHISIVSDTTDESFPVPPVKSENPYKGTLTNFGAPPILPPPNTEGIIDLTSSFKAVQCLISPLKSDETTSIQVPATRNPTIRASPKIWSDEPRMGANMIRLKMRKIQLSSAKEYFSRLFEMHLIDAQTNVPDTEAEDNDEDFCVIDLEPIAENSRDGQEFHLNSQILSQSAAKMRQNLKEIGLKPSRSKSEMIASLQAASQVLDASTDTKEQRKEVYDLLTTLVQSSPSLHEKVYTFQPIVLKDLIKQLAAANPFVDHLNEPIIREWADMQGICLRSS
ncbi:hypothetical protein HG535_0G03780 [Zygotorulaspora mrakii]|uniref:Structure-specific endonuclease subunit SLX4 n=1 Tax=Zygotorulaspora mrakii TaxID=42260 RepID=A0A7H9B6Z3_ZYGMR|nr:uncharacterized protein HG535_0G03780 [Zygotorulaspora mrakii]QLG74495.1 hypothetical protein HG535_0G03780 [Zygotorulaspora mrakii]